MSLLLLGSGNAGGGAAGVWTTVYTATLGLEIGPWVNNNMRQSLDEALYSVSGSKIRLTLQGGTSEAMNIGSMYFGHNNGGQPYDFDGSQIQITVGSSSTFIVPQSGTVVTDEQAYAFDASKDVTWAVYSADATKDMMAWSNTEGVGTLSYFKVAGDETASSAPGGMTLIGTGGTVILINKIEVLVP